MSYFSSRYLDEIILVSEIIYGCLFIHLFFTSDRNENCWWSVVRFQNSKVEFMNTLKYSVYSYFSGILFLLNNKLTNDVMEAVLEAAGKAQGHSRTKT